MVGGVLRGTGKQLIGALCNLVGYYMIGFPIGVSLMFAANMGIVGKNRPLVLYVSLSPVCQMSSEKPIKVFAHLC